MSVERAAKQGCVGSGKRRALLLASQFSFKEIIGVELSPSLHRIAYSNIQIYRDDFQRCRKIRSICGDAAKYQIPPEKAVFYLFNPFDEEVMHMVLSNIIYSDMTVDSRPKSRVPCGFLLSGCFPSRLSLCPIGLERKVVTSSPEVHWIEFS
jgi:hypothetical protein